MRKLLISITFLAAALSARAQLTPDGIMALLPNMPTQAEMIRYAKESCAPVSVHVEVTQPTLYDDFREALQAALEKASGSTDQNLEPSMNKKINADKGKRASSQKQYQLVTELISLGQKEHSLQQKAIWMIESARKEGVALFDRKYRKADEQHSEEMHRAALELEDAIGEAAYKAALARLNAAQSAWFNNMSQFYAEYIPLYRDAVAGAMDCCRAELLPVKRQHKEVMEQLYALTRSAEYALSESIPFEASYMYFELSEKITEFELTL